jgi:hypothetical protein
MQQCHFYRLLRHFRLTAGADESDATVLSGNNWLRELAYGRQTSHGGGSDLAQCSNEKNTSISRVQTSPDT